MPATDSFFDATPHAEFIYARVLQTIEHDLPEETRVLQRYDQFCFGLRAILDMPNRTMDLLYRLLAQNDGKLPDRARSKAFSELTSREAEQIEGLYAGTLEEPQAPHPVCGPLRPSGLSS